MQLNRSCLLLRLRSFAAVKTLPQYRKNPLDHYLHQASNPHVLRQDPLIRISVLLSLGQWMENVFVRVIDLSSALIKISTEYT